MITDRLSRPSRPRPLLEYRLSLDLMPDIGAVTSYSQQWKARVNSCFAFLNVNSTRLQINFHTNLPSTEHLSILLGFGHCIRCIRGEDAFKCLRWHKTSSGGKNQEKETPRRTLTRPTCQGGAKHDIDLWF